MRELISSIELLLADKKLKFLQYLKPDKLEILLLLISKWESKVFSSKPSRVLILLLLIFKFVTKFEIRGNLFILLWIKFISLSLRILLNSFISIILLLLRYNVRSFVKLYISENCDILLSPKLSSSRLEDLGISFIEVIEFEKQTKCSRSVSVLIGDILLISFWPR